MKIKIAARKVDVPDKLKETINKKVGKLSKFFDDSTEVNITLSVQRELQIAEATIYSSGMIYRAEERNTDMYASIDKIVDIIERQIRKNKTRLEKKLRTNAFAATPGTSREVEEESEFRIMKIKKHSIKPMSPEEAILQMNLLGHEFFVFQNANTDLTNIVYRRKDGNYGLIETA